MDNNKMAQSWANEQGVTEEKAFEWAVKSSTIKKNDCEYQRGFDEGYKKGLEDAQQVTLEKFNGIIEENTELRRQIKVMNDMNTRLREAMIRNSEMEYD